jgi:hypothetical protein
MFKSLGSILHGRMQLRSTIAKGVHTALSVEACQAAIDELMGAGIATAASLKQGRLHVRASNSSAAQDLHLRRGEVREACNQKCGPNAVREVRVST